MILNGRELANKILVNLKKRNLRSTSLAAIVVGDDPASMHFLRQKELACKKIGVKFILKKYPKNISQQAFSRNIRNIVSDSRITGVIIQLPLPRQLGNPVKFLNLIPKEKDPDVLGSEALGEFTAGSGKILPPVVGAIALVLEKYRVGLRGKTVAVIGAGRLVGKPSAIWFINQEATVTILNKWTKSIEQDLKKSDIVVSGAGIPGIVRGSMIKRGAIVLDAGYAIKQGKPAGDCDIRSVYKKARLVTPVPGGMGPLAVAMLLKNLAMLKEYKAYD